MSESVLWIWKKYMSFFELRILRVKLKWTPPNFDQLTVQNWTLTKKCCCCAGNHDARAYFWILFRCKNTKTSLAYTSIHKYVQNNTFTGKFLGAFKKFKNFLLFRPMGNGRTQYMSKILNFVLFFKALEQCGFKWHPKFLRLYCRKSSFFDFKLKKFRLRLKI